MFIGYAYKNIQEKILEWNKLGRREVTHKGKTI